MSPQGDGLYHQANLLFHHNIVAHAECESPTACQRWLCALDCSRCQRLAQLSTRGRSCADCFEIWSQGNTSQCSMRHVRFENNLCVDSGGGWSHAVRPDPSGR